MTNIIQFPGQKGPASQNEKAVSTKPERKFSPRQWLIAGSLLSVILASVATNRMTFKDVESLEMSSTGGRGLASVGRSMHRNTTWEKSLAESLASADVRGPASFNIGREVTMEDSLRHGKFENYSMSFTGAGHELRSIEWQGDKNVVYMTPEEFFRDYGQLVNKRFKEARVTGEPQVNEKGQIVESYMIIDVDNRPVQEVKVGTDRHGRFFSFEISSNEAF